MPIRGVEAVGGDRSAIVTWLEQRNGIPDVADYVEIEVCHKFSNHCSSPIQTDFGTVWTVKFHSKPSELPGKFGISLFLFSGASFASYVHAI